MPGQIFSDLFQADSDYWDSELVAKTGNGNVFRPGQKNVDSTVDAVVSAWLSNPDCDSDDLEMGIPGLCEGVLASLNVGLEHGVSPSIYLQRVRELAPPYLRAYRAQLFCEVQRIVADIAQSCPAGEL